MSLRYEQHRALRHARDFLRELLTVEGYPRTKREMRARACSCLRHFPPLRDDGAPIFSNDNLKPPTRLT